MITLHSGLILVYKWWISSCAIIEDCVVVYAESLWTDTEPDIFVIAVIIQIVETFLIWETPL